MADTTQQDLAKLRVQLASLDRAMASGALTIEQADNGGRTTYRSYAEMQQARRDLSRRIDGLDATLTGTRRRRTRRVVMIGTGGF